MMIQKIFKNFFYYWIGFGVLVLNKIRYSLLGYRSPKPFTTGEIQRCIDYDYKVVEEWLGYLQEYTNSQVALKDKTVLELGPGSDLGVGIILLSKGVKQYNALDVNNLVENVPNDFYDLLFQNIKSRNSCNNIDFLVHQLNLTRQGNNDALNYVCRDDFNVSIFKENGGIDLIFSQAAFEHFDDIDKTFSQLNGVVKHNAILIAEVDLVTHTRFIKDVDPLNIYRYSELIYSLISFRGAPNRVRPYEYENILKKYGWEDIQIKPLSSMNSNYMELVHNSLDKKFVSSQNQMQHSSIVLMARKNSQ